jgi:hypothetical protein
MIIDDIKEQICMFNNRKEKFKKYHIDDIFKKFDDFDSIQEAIKELLLSNNCNKIESASNFVVFIIKNANETDSNHFQLFTDYLLEEENIFEVMSENLESDNIFIRQIAIDDLSQLTNYFCKESFNSYFDFYKENDPINLPNYILGRIRQNKEISYDLLDEIVRNDNYLIRWSFFNILSRTNLDCEKTYDLLNILKSDPKDFIKNEAEYYYNKTKIKKDNENIDYVDADNSSSEYKNLKIPELNFNDMITNFYDLLKEINTDSYEISELDEFALFYIKNKQSIVKLFLEYKSNGF